MEPGASVVLTHGLLVSPFSTAFLASRAAPIITEGFEVLVHDVIAAIATAPWSTSNLVPSLERDLDRVARAATVGRGRGTALRRLAVAVGRWLGASEAGKDSSTASSYPLAVLLSLPSV